MTIYRDLNERKLKWSGLCVFASIFVGLLAGQVDVSSFFCAAWRWGRSDLLMGMAGLREKHASDVNEQTSIK